MVVDCLEPNQRAGSALHMVARAREEYLVNGDCPSSAVRPVIKQSWNRCTTGGVSPTAPIPRPNINEDSLEKVLHYNSDLVLALKDVKLNLSSVLEETESILMLADAKGVLVDMFGNRKLHTLANSAEIVPGHSWDEVSAGTNAIGTAIQIKQAVEIHTFEHYCE